MITRNNIKIANKAIYILFMSIFLSNSFAQSVKRTPFVAVMPLTGQGVDVVSAQVVTDALSDELMKSGQVRVMERSQMENIIKEQGFQQSGACDGSECAVEMGKLLSIDKMVVGSLGKIGGSFSLSVRILDVGTGEVLGSARRQQDGKIEDVTTNLVPSVTNEILNSISSNNLPISTSRNSDKKSHWGWWVVGGVAIAGGTAAAIIISQSVSNESTSNSTGNIENTSWTTKVRW